MGALAHLTKVFAHRLEANAAAVVAEHFDDPHESPAGSGRMEVRCKTASISFRLRDGMTTFGRAVAAPHPFLLNGYWGDTTQGARWTTTMQSQFMLRYRLSVQVELTSFMRQVLSRPSLKPFRAALGGVFHQTLRELSDHREHEAPIWDAASSPYAEAWNQFPMGLITGDGGVG